MLQRATGRLGKIEGMKRLLIVAAGLLTACSGRAAPLGAQLLSVDRRPAAELAGWPTEQIELLDGRKQCGLIESQDNAWVYLTEIHRPEGRPMYLVIRPLERTAIAKVVRLEPRQRAALRQRIEQFINRARIEAGRMEAVRLSLADHHGTHYQRYRGKWFSLDSRVNEPTTRRVIVRVEQVFTAYRQILAPRAESRRPLRMVVFGSLEEYHRYLARFNLQLGNRAVFLRERNLVVAGSELERYAARLDKVRAGHDELRAELELLEKQLPTRLEEISRQMRKQGKTRDQIAALLNRHKRAALAQIEQKRKQLRSYDRRNNRAFDEVARQMFARIYHEAFHAYLENYVYPHDRHDVPHWLNEGLAVMFEGGLLESGSLRLDAPNRAALAGLKADLAGDRPLGLKELLEADGRNFLVAGGASAESSNRHYYHAWGLVYYLTFQQRLLQSPALDRYVAQDARHLPPVVRFEALVDMPLAEFEQAWRKYVLELR